MLDDRGFLFSSKRSGRGVMTSALCKGQRLKLNISSSAVNDKMYLISSKAQASNNRNVKTQIWSTYRGNIRRTWSKPEDLTLI